jgi:hypothetical protein
VEDIFLENAYMEYHVANEVTNSTVSLAKINTFVSFLFLTYGLDIL